MYKREHLYGDIMIYRHKHTSMFKLRFARCLIHGNSCPIRERLNHLTIGIMYRLTLREGTVDLTSALKSQLTHPLRFLTVPLKSESIRHCC